MKRHIEEILKNWKTDRQRRPLLVRGARQVGKSYTVNEFGNKEFDNLITINFELEPEYKDCFTSLKPGAIIETISILSKKKITPGKTLLFLDEIQECPRAITALRYFYEQMPELHVIAAGSLLEFSLSQEKSRMPVGRVQYLYMKPLSFLEFLDALGENKSRQVVENIDLDNLPQPVIHEHLLALTKKYAILGGMPAVVEEYTASGDLTKCQQIQKIIIQTYRDDFGKYAAKVKHKYMEKIFYAVPKLVGKKFKYSHVDNTIPSRELKNALELLEKAGVLHRVKKTGGSGLPLEANSDERHFKTTFLDIGLMQNMCGLDREMLFSGDFMKINAGALAEQFAAQELLAYRDPFQENRLYYWAREARNSNAEVDYLVPWNSYAVPVEVKSGKTGTLRSMHLFLEKYPAPVGIRISQQFFNTTPPVISIPFYAVKKIPRLIQNCL
ncbi:MAG: ATP-binding protein [Candidatus Aminicenantes bacterium]|nr:ATP-binding protein [Candidatus Aminicenantes bacterium]